MSDLKLKPELRQSFITYISSDGQSVTVWAQTYIKDVLKFESIKDLNYRQMFEIFFQTKETQIKPLVEKYYIFCDKTKVQFYRILIKRVEEMQSLVFFIDFGYEEEVPNICLFVFDQMFIDCKPLVQKFRLSDIRPKDLTKGFDSQRVVKSLEKYLRSIVLFAINSDNSMKAFNNDGEEIFNSCLENDGIDDIVFDNIESNKNLIAIDFDNDYENNRTSITLTSDFKSTQSLAQFSDLPNSSAEVMTKTPEKNELSSNSIVMNETAVETTEQSLDSTIDSEESPKKKFSDKTDKQSLVFHMKTLFGPKLMVFVTKTLSMESIYIQLKRDWDSIEEMSKSLTECYKNAILENEYPLKIEDLEPNVVIAAKFEDDQQWYRAQVVSTKRKKCLVKVFYIDFGNTETIELKSCRFLKPEFRTHPPYAIHCHPLNEKLGSDTLEIYETNSIEIECEFIALEKETMDVLLYDHGVLLSCDSVCSSPQRKEEKHKNPIETQIIEKFDLKAKEEKPKAKETQELPKSVLQMKELFEVNQEFLLNLVNTQNTAIISKAYNSQSIYIHLEKELNTTIRPLVLDMKDFYESSKHIEALEDEELMIAKSLKTLIAVHWDLEEKWLRAQVSNITEESVEVFFVDFGNNATVPKSSCRALADIYFTTIFQAIHCRPNNKNLKYYQLKDFESSEKAFELRFLELKENNVFEVTLKLQ